MRESLLFRSYGLLGSHCNALIIENAKRTPCEEKASVIYVDRDGVRHGYGPEHLDQGHQEATLRGWVRLDELRVAA